MSVVVHRTPGLLDIRSVTVMGLSAKPAAGGHPIGMFGTGLKYAISTLVRLGARVSIFIGETEHVFVLDRAEFRGQEFQQLAMKRRKNALWRKERLPFTTEYGKFWQPWMAFRELHSNTLDEQGWTEVMSDDENEGFAGLEGHTTIVVELDAYTDAALKKDEVFLPEARRKSETYNDIIQTFPEESRLIYYRGLRVWEAPKPCVRTYNVLTQLQLTEDRTLSGDWYLKSYLANAVMTSNDEAWIKDVLTASEDYFEHRLEFPAHVTPSEAFTRVASLYHSRAHRSVYGLYSAHTPRERRSLTPWERHARPWTVESDGETYGEVHDALGRPIMVMPPGFNGDWGMFAQEVVDLVNNHAASDAAARTDAKLELDAAVEESLARSREVVPDARPVDDLPPF